MTEGATHGTTASVAGMPFGRSVTMKGDGRYRVYKGAHR